MNKFNRIAAIRFWCSVTPTVPRAKSAEFLSAGRSAAIRSSACEWGSKAGQLKAFFDPLSLAGARVCERESSPPLRGAQWPHQDVIVKGRTELGGLGCVVQRTVYVRGQLQVNLSIRIGLSPKLVQ